MFVRSTCTPLNMYKVMGRHGISSLHDPSDNARGINRRLMEVSGRRTTPKCMPGGGHDNILKALSMFCCTMSDTPEQGKEIYLFVRSTCTPLNMYKVMARHGKARHGKAWRGEEA